MKTKLKILLFLILLNSCFTLFLTPLTVKASQTVYLRVLKEEVYIYEDSTLTKKMFSVPYGYFVKVENANSDYVRVTYGYDDLNYPVINGYMSPEDLSVFNGEPTKPFSVIKVSSLYSDVLFNDFDLKKAYFNVPPDTFMYYFGSYVNDKTSLCYVYLNGKLGYIDINSLNPFTVPESPDEITNTPPQNSNDNIKNENTTPAVNLAENLQVVIIVGISVISISVVYFLFRPTKQVKQTLAPDEEEV